MTATAITPTMTVTVTLNLEVDPTAWAAALLDGEDVTTSQVRSDVKQYICRALASATASDGGFLKGLTVK